MCKTCCQMLKRNPPTIQSDIMTYKIKCPRCRKMNDLQKFCIYCGGKLPVDDDKIRLMGEKPEASCLNCGRPVEKGQVKCECGYEFRDIKCPECLAENEYTNKFCTSCGEKLWRSEVFDYQYESHFGFHLLSKDLPHELRNISVSRRNRTELLKPMPQDSRRKKDCTRMRLKAMNRKVESNKEEILSRWKVVSPRHCISCLGIIEPQNYKCPKCGFDFRRVRSRVDELKSEKNNYSPPVFDREDLKFSDEFESDYAGSLAPSPGESQLEYRERLKWEFTENGIYKDNIKLKLFLTPDTQSVKTVQHHEQNTENGGYCNYSCRHYCEELLDSSGGIVGDFTDTGIVDHYCDLGYSLSYGSFCEHYEK